MIEKISTEFKNSIALKPSTLLILGTLFLLFNSSYFPGAKTFLVIIVSIALFYIGEKYSRKFNPTLTIERETLFYFGAGLILISLLALYFNFFAAGGIPLFNSAIRRFLSAPLTYASFLAVPGIIFIIASFEIKKTAHAKLKTFLLIIFAAALMALLGFRTEVLAAILGGT